MKLTKREMVLLALCLGHCNTCSESVTCKLKNKISHIETTELDGIVYDALANYYGQLYGIQSERS